MHEVVQFTSKTIQEFTLKFKIDFLESLKIQLFLRLPAIRRL